MFLGAGSVIHAVADNQDFRKFGGLISYLPLTYSVMLIASLSLVAFPFMTGFYSKDFILESAYGQFSFSGVAVYIIATIGAIFTTLYSVKVLYLTFLANPNGPKTYYSLPVDNLFSNTKSYKPAHEGDLFLSLPLVILALFSIFFGFITKDIFIGLGSNFFVDNSLFIHPIHEIMIDTEFAVPVLFKLLPFIFTISFSIIALTLSELLSELVIYFKFSRLGYNIFGFFNQRFLIEFFYNKYITNLILNLGGQITKILDKGSIELFGPFGLEKGLVKLSKNISSLSTSHVTTYALYILVGFIIFIYIYYTQFNLCLILVIILLMIGNGDSSGDIDREINYNNYNKQLRKNPIIYIYNNKMMFSTSASLLNPGNSGDDSGSAGSSNPGNSDNGSGSGSGGNPGGNPGNDSGLVSVDSEVARAKEQQFNEAKERRDNLGEEYKVINMEHGNAQDREDGLEELETSQSLIYKTNEFKSTDYEVQKYNDQYEKLTGQRLPDNEWDIGWPTERGTEADGTGNTRSNLPASPDATAESSSPEESSDKDNSNNKGSISESESGEEHPPLKRQKIEDNDDDGDDNNDGGGGGGDSSSNNPAGGDNFSSSNDGSNKVIDSLDDKGCEYGELGVKDDDLYLYLDLDWYLDRLIEFMQNPSDLWGSLLDLIIKFIG